MNEEELEAAIKRRIRFVARDSRGYYSNTWKFWGHASDFYFGARYALDALKVSLHDNGRGYIGFDKNYRATRQVPLPKTLHEWALPVVRDSPSLIASILLPAAYFSPREHPPNSKTLPLPTITHHRLAAEIAVYCSRSGTPHEWETTLSSRGYPLTSSTLDDGRTFHTVYQEVAYDPRIIPSGPLTGGTQTILDPNVLSGPAEDYENLHALLWTKPGDGEVLKMIDIAGVKFQRNQAAT